MMTQEVINRKLIQIAAYLEDLRPYQNISFDEYMQDHYSIERILELIVITASDLILHMLKEKNEPSPGSYSAAFLRAGEIGLITSSLAQNLSESAGLRNILVHQYEKVDNHIVHQSVNRALVDYQKFLKEMTDKS